MQIGWKQIRYGQFLLKWHEYQQKYETTVYGSTDQGTPKWLRKIVSTIWTFAKTRWLARCTKNYGTKNSNYSLYQENLIARIQNWYNQEQDFPPQDRHPFQQTMDYWKSANVTQLKRWILIHHAFLQKSAKRGKQQKRMQVRDIRRYFNESKNDNNSSKNKNTTNKDTNIPTKGKYATGKAHGPQNQKREKKRQKARHKETPQIKDIRQFFDQTGTNNSTNKNKQNHTKKGNNTEERRNVTKEET